MLKAAYDLLYKQQHKFKAQQRIPRSEGYAKCLGSTSVGNQHYKLFYIVNQTNHARLGIIAAKRIQPKAVDRNSSKRAVREVFRLHSIAKKPLDLVVMVRRGAVVSGKNHQQMLAGLFSQIETRCVDS